MSFNYAISYNLTMVSAFLLVLLMMYLGFWTESLFSMKHFSLPACKVSPSSAQMPRFQEHSPFRSSLWHRQCLKAHKQALVIFFRLLSCETTIYYYYLVLPWGGFIIVCSLLEPGIPNSYTPDPYTPSRSVLQELTRHSALKLPALEISSEWYKEVDRWGWLQGMQKPEDKDQLGLSLLGLSSPPAWP